MATIPNQRRARSPFGRLIEVDTLADAPAERARIVRARRVASRPRAAAVAWQDARLPGLGRVRAIGWPPAIQLAACAVALVYLLETSGVATAGYDIQRLQTEKREWELRNEQLRLESSKMHSLAWVESQAINRLGMQPADKPTFLAVPGSPAAAPSTDGTSR